MFQNQELARLQQRKALLVTQIESNRQKLVDDLRHLSSTDLWIEGAYGVLRRRPAIAAGLAAMGGMLAVRFLGKSGGITGAIGQVGKLASIAGTLWGLFRKKKEP